MGSIYYVKSERLTIYTANSIFSKIYSTFINRSNRKVLFPVTLVISQVNYASKILEKLVCKLCNEMFYMAFCGSSGFHKLKIRLP